MSNGVILTQHYLHHSSLPDFYIRSWDQSGPCHKAHVIAGRCSTVFEGTREQEQHGDMILLIKPDSTR